MAITDLTGYTWYGNNTLNITGTADYYIDFDVIRDIEPRLIRYVELRTSVSSKGVKSLRYYLSGSGSLLVYSDGTWTQRYPFNIVGGTDVTNAELIAWLEANGTLTPPTPTGSTVTATYNNTELFSEEMTLPVAVTYNGSTIATLNDGDTKTLSCNGKVMASNVVIGGKTLQCSGKLMASDVVVSVGGEPPPPPVTDETWVINEEPVGASFTEMVNFQSGGENYTQFEFITVPAPFGVEYRIKYDSTYMYYSSHPEPTFDTNWRREAYRTITLDSPATGDFLTWLQNNAVKQ